MALSAPTGTIVTQGATVVWSKFQLAPGKVASAAIQVSLTPTLSQVGSQILLSSGVDADAVDVVTGTNYTVSYGTLTTGARVERPATTKPPAGPASVSASAPPASTAGTGTGTLPKSGGGAPLLPLVTLRSGRG